MIRLKVENSQGQTLAQAQGGQEAYLVYEPEYQPGDCLVLECEEGGEGRHLILRLDDAMSPALVYLKGGRFCLPVPFGEKRVSYSPRSFVGGQHLLWARLARPDEVAARRNLALNPYDCHENTSLFPHASANVETRGEAVFAARNAIDGIIANHSHGQWPFASWGINRDPDALLRLDFGRPVLLEAAAVYLRADFPHDAWWERITLSFSDGSSLEAALEKTGAAQQIAFAPRRVQWLTVGNLIKADDPSPFPALTQLEAYGRDEAW